MASYKDFIGQTSSVIYLDTENNQFYTDTNTIDLPLHYRVELEEIKGSEDFFTLGSAIEAEAENDPEIREALGLKTKAWFLVDDCTSKRCAMWAEKLNVGSRKEAISEMVSSWDMMTDHDKGLRDAYWVGLCEVDEDGCPDYDTAEWCYGLDDLAEDREYERRGS